MQSRPFFLYFATHDIHVPRVPGPKFKGSSQCGVRGDVIQELDWSVGQVMQKLDELKVTDNTLVIFSSDNGPVVNDGYKDGSVENLNGHAPAGPLRGGKYTNWEGGTRMPLITFWPGHIKPNTTTAAMLCQVDLLASLAKLCGAKVQASSSPDSMDLLDVLLGKSDHGRDLMVEQGSGPLTLAIRKGNWKLIPLLPGVISKSLPTQTSLFDLSTDIGEEHNIAADHPDKVAELSKLLQKIRDQVPTTKPSP